MSKKNILLLGSIFLAMAFLFLLAKGFASAQPSVQVNTDFGIKFWPDGIVWYQFDTNPDVDLNDVQKDIVRGQMVRWEDALNLTDSLHLDQKRQYILFKECDAINPCAGRNFVNIQYIPTHNGNFCGWNDDNGDHAGMHPDPGGVTNLELREFDENDVLHELGHCLGLWHDHNRDDVYRWVILRTPTPFAPPTNQIMPILGNYDYDSVMHYASFTPTSTHCNTNIWFTDKLGNTICRWISDSVSKRDISRILQYYAYEHQPNWGFFTTLNKGLTSSTDPFALPDPYLSAGVEAVGSPAISYQSPGNYDIFVLGSDHRLYWKPFRNDSSVDWASLGCCFGSEPAAVSRLNGEIDLVAVGYDTGKLIYSHFENGSWGGWSYIRDGYPIGGIKGGTVTKFIGPAVAARSISLLDVFGVRTDGLLTVTTFQNNNWSEWRTVGGGYNVTARPAAFGLSANQVQLAINESGTNLYEPKVDFSPQNPFFTKGNVTGHPADSTPPTLAWRWEDPLNPYRVLITNQDGRISHRFTLGRWRDIGGIPKNGTGPFAVASGPYSALIVMNGEDAWSCLTSCVPEPQNLGDPDYQPGPGAGYIQPGGLWLRVFSGVQTEIYYAYLPMVRR